MKEKLFDMIKWDENGLVACVVQDEKDGAVLMVAYMNRISLEKTIKDKKACFWSRSRKKLWLKGEESGNVQEVKKITVDCDGDCILIQVKQIGDAACHTGMRSCFYRKVNDKAELVEEGKRIFDPEKVYKKN
jgi:phosphoribosyl-AMP cyclohydrolase